MGPVGVVFVYVLINLGLAVVLTYSSIGEKIGDLASVAQVYGLSRPVFIKNIFFPLLWRDLLDHFFLIFIFCLSSFSVPLMAGGGKGTNLEVLIYEKIFIGQDWSGAFTLALLQSAVIFILSLVILKKKSHRSTTSLTRSYLRSKVGAVLLLLYLATYIGGYLLGLTKSLPAFYFFADFAGELWRSSLFSLVSLFVYILWSLFLLLLWIWDYITNKKINPAINLLYASTVTVGFSFYLLFPLAREYDRLKLVLAMSILVFPTMFKLFIEPALLGLREQVRVAEILGLKTKSILYEVVFLQLRRRALWGWLSFSVLWFLSDYAVSRAIGLQTRSLGLMSESFLGSYRLSLGYLLSFYIFILSLLAVGVIYLVLRLGDVVYKKFIS
jgi:thiamine transport system permease protein